MSKMKIKLLKQGWMTTSGSSLLRMMQNVNTPKLDLLVREALQNSCDASIENDKVKVNFRYDYFDVDKLSEEFESIGNKLKNISKSNTQNYLAICDTRTKGLTGNLNGIFKNDEKNQNLGKLVFQIMKPQENEGAGGSWGIGKTVYYRLGVGLVIYYSRIKLDNGDFQNRLVAALVEDEKSPDGILSGFGESNLGAAFFGKENNDNYNGLEAIIDDEYISKFLSIFNMKPYKNDTTGTAIIIPFIDEEETLCNNASSDDERLWWNERIEDNLKVSILRWYFPRLSRDYAFGARLSVSINDETVLPGDDTLLFQKFSELYSAAFSETYDTSWINKKEVTRKKNVEDKVIGWFMYGKVDSTVLGISRHLPDPYKYIGYSKIANDYNTPIICFCRQPGMIINYKIDWNVKCNKNEAIIGVFVLNSKNKVTSPGTISLEEYLRQSEKSDHTMWVDHSIKNGVRQVNIVGGIYNSIRYILESQFGDKEIVSGQGEVNTVLAHKYGKKFLPDEKFGNYHSTPGLPHGGGGASKNKNKINYIKTSYKDNVVQVEYEVTLMKAIKSLKIETLINSINSPINYEKWENNGLSFPLNINTAVLRVTSINNKENLKYPYFIKEGQNVFENYNVKFLKSSKNKVVGLSFNQIDGKEFIPIKFILRMDLFSEDKYLQYNFKFDLEDDSIEK